MSRKVESEHKIYVVMYSCGQYEDSVTGTVCAFETREEAEDFIQLKEDWKNNVTKKAIKDREIYYDEDECDYEENPDDNAYTNLYNEFQDYFYKKLFGDKKDDELTAEDWDEYNEYDTDEQLKKYMIEIKGYSEEVAESTIVYNECGDWGDYHTYYYIEEVSFIKNNK